MSPESWFALEDELKQRFAKRLRFAREDRGLSQRQLDQLCGFAATRSCQLERGARMPSVQSLARLCTVLRVSAGWLLGLE